MAPIAEQPRDRHPQFASIDEDGDRLYTWRGESFYSVTTQIGGGVPKYLHPHYAKMAAELAFDELFAHGPNSRASAIANRLTRAGRTWVQERQAAGELKTIKLEKLTDRDLALRWLKGAADRHRDAAAAQGIEVHDEAEALVLQHARAASRLVLAGIDVAPWPDHLGGYQASFLSWLEDWHPEFLATEATVFNRDQAYAGTLDCIVRLRAGDLVDAIEREGPIDPSIAWLLELDPDELVIVIVDYKSGRAVYAEVALQLAAYARGQFIAGADGVTEHPVPPIRLGAVLHLTAKRARFSLVRIDDAMFDAYRYAREIYRWRKQQAATAFLHDLKPARSAPDPDEPVEEVA